MSWQERRLARNVERENKSVLLRSNITKTWEERFEDDPLKSDMPTKNYEEDIDYYQNTYVIMSEVKDVTLRQQAWVHHMQWVRRHTLIPNIATKVLWEYTRLSDDYMSPIGQIMGIKANSSAEIEHLLATEPLHIVGGVQSWDVYEFDQFIHDNTTVPLSDPKMFISSLTKEDFITEKEEEIYQNHLKYHTNLNRVSMLGKLRPIANSNTNMKVTASKNKNLPKLMLLFNAKTDGDAVRYVSSDPIMKYVENSKNVKGMISTVNEQDVDGLNHMMARTFSEKSVLDQVRVRGTSV